MYIGPLMSSEMKRIEEANAAFYSAVESFDLERMDALWAHEPWVVCVHPGWDVITGWEQVRESWEGIFEGAQRLGIFPSAVAAQVSGDFAWVTCIENITAFYESTFDSALAAATNLFIRRGDLWLMVHHHASPIPMILPDNSTEIIQ